VSMRPSGEELLTPGCTHNLLPARHSLGIVDGSL
jgi:hypothetical protein